MKFILPTLLFSSLAVSTAVDTTLAPRSAKSILAAISVISSDIQTLNSSVTSFNGDNFAAIKIVSQSSDLADDIEAATNTTKASAKLKNAGSSKVGTAILKLQPDIYSLLDNIVAHKDQFQGSAFGFGGYIVLDQLKDQKEKTDEFGAAIQSKLTKSFASLAPKIRRQIDRAFDKAIAAYDEGSPFASQ